MTQKINLFFFFLNGGGESEFRNVKDYMVLALISVTEQLWPLKYKQPHMLYL